MGARVVRLRTKAERIRENDARDLRQLVLDFAAGRRISERAANEITAAIDRETSTRNGWTFCMISPQANAAVVMWLTQHSKRPLVAVRLWASLFQYINRDTCEIVRTRAELAESLDVPTNEISRLMSELEGIGAISRRREGVGVRYYMNPLIGTHLTGAARTKAQAKAPKLKLVPAG